MELDDIAPISKFMGWFNKNWEFVGVALLVSLYMFLANFFMWAQTFLGLFVNFSGGSDPYFNYIIIQYILSNHVTLLHTINLNYPIGSGNPRNPFFHWMIAFIAVILSPLFGSASNAAYYAFMEFDAVFGALLIIPVYMLGKSILGKKAGMIGAILYTLMPSNLSSGILSDGRMHTPELIFAFFAIYFVERAVRYASKERIIRGSFLNIKAYPEDIKHYIKSNRKTTVYALLAGATYGALQLSWQGHAYILAIVTIYIVFQLIVNLFLGRNNEYLVYISTIFVALSFSMSAYYYYSANNDPSAWFIPPLYIGLGMIIISLFMSIVGRKPWIISVPVMIILVSVTLLGLFKFAPHIFNEIISGEGYFIKTRVYQTIAEAQSPPLGQYISGFGVAQFILGIAGFAYVVYLYFKERSDSVLLLLVFSGVSIYMSFAAARFNVTAAPSYAILGAAILTYFSNLVKLHGGTYDEKSKKSYRRNKALSGDIKWVQGLFVLIVVFGILIPSGLGVVSAAVPGNSAGSVNHQVYNALPSFLKPSSYQSNQSAYFGITGSFITNSTTPLSQSMTWLSSQQSNLPISKKPAYVNWWDYGFQELAQGKHPTVADDFQQAYQVAGQILLSQNQSQIIALMSARLIQASMESNNGQLSPALANALSPYMNTTETQLLTQIFDNPIQYVPWIMSNSTVYGNFIPSISPQNAYFVLMKGQLASKVSLPNLVNLYQSLQASTGWSIQYIQVDHSLFPLSGLNTGIFYAPAYLTDTPSYITPGGGVVPTNYYQIFAQTSNGTFPLNQLPTNIVPTGYSIQYTPAFYNTTIYRALIGLPPSAVGQTQGIPGLTFGTTKYTMQPAWNMSNFEIVYEGVPYNPYKNYSAHVSSFKLLPLQQAYTLNKEGNGTAFIFPQVSSIIQGSDPILRYFPGAIISGQVKTSSGIPEAGIRVTIVDQYGIPHQTVLTNSNGFYNITGLPGNDTILFSYGKMNSVNLEGKNFLHADSVYISNQQAERKSISLNSTTGLPNYYVVKNYAVTGFKSNGLVELVKQKGINQAHYNVTKISNGTVILQNHITGIYYNYSFTGGQYNVTDLPQGNYTVSVLTNGHLYSDIQSNVYTPGSNTLYDIKIPMSLIQANVTYQGKRVAGAHVYAGSFNATTNSNGTAYLYTFNGTYSVFAKYGNSVSPKSSVSISTLGGNSSLNLTILPGAKVRIQVNNSAFSPSSIRIFQSAYSGNGYGLGLNGSAYSGVVPFGYYTVYDTYNNITVFQSFNINTSGTYYVNAYSSYNLQITNQNENVSILSGYLSITYGKGTVLFPVQALNHILQLPGGYNYEIYVYASQAFNQSVANTVVNLNSNEHTYLTLQKATSAQIGIYNTAVANVFDSKSAVSNGVSFIYLDGSIYGTSFVGSQGYATITYDSTSLQGFSLKAYSGGFSTSTVSATSQSNTPLNVKQSNVSIRFNSLNGGSNLDGKISLVGYSNYSFNIVSGIANFTVPFGAYYLNIYGGNQQVSTYDQIITISSEDYSSIMNFTSFVQFGVNGAQSIRLFSNGTLVNPVNGTYYPGEYTVYELGTGSQSGIARVNLTQNTTFNSNLNQSNWLNLSNNLGIQNGILTVNTSYGPLEFSQTSVLLPSAQYSVSYNANIANSTGEYLLSKELNVILTSNFNQNITLNVQKFFTDVNGYVIENGNGAKAVNVSIYSNNKLITWTLTSGDGHYNVSLPNGTYTAYAYSKSLVMASLSTFSVNTFQQNLSNNLTLSNGHYITVYTYLGNTIQNLVVNATVSNIGLSFNSGNSMLLPAMNLSFSAYISSQNQINNYSFSQKFSDSFITNTNVSKSITLTLTRLVTGNISLKQNYTATNVSEYSTVNYQLNVTNLLNTPANLTLSSGNSSWKIKFNVSSFKNLGINLTKSISAKITNIQLVPSGINKIPVNIAYNGGGSTTDYIKVNMTRNYSASLNLSSNFAAFDGGNITYTAILKNTGNSNETVNLSSYIYNTYNWAVKFSIGGKAVNYTNLSYGQSESVKIILIPGNNYYNQPFNFTIRYSIFHHPTNSNGVINLFVEFPNLGSLYNTASGTGVISNYTGNPFSTIEIGIIVIVVAVIAGLAGVAIRGRRK
ncbi:MAG: glycosyltransferase family 39 protein [Candidatus Thermoplasmatota archaeon]|nr:glycosyltransferase family 39 protein [Candidatus Thermoplasmatota archaeon]